MAHIADTARGGRRSLDAAVNLVPYVDILMTLMVFLVMCAVFTQMAALTTHTAGGAATAEHAAEDADETRVHVSAASIRVERGAAGVDVPRGDRAALEAALRDVQACRVRADDGVGYGALVEVVDVAHAAGATQVSLEGAQG